MPSIPPDDVYLDRLRDYYARYHGLPSYSRLAGILGIVSRSAVGKVLGRLRDTGYLARTPDDVWVPTPRFFERQLADGHVPAGVPVTLNDSVLDRLLVDEYLIDKPSCTVLITVKGDSMVDVGIHSGDKVVVEKGAQAKTGDIVVAIVDNEFTIKTLGVERGEPVLLPANRAYPVIRPRDSLEIYGVVVGLARRYRR